MLDFSDESEVEDRGREDKDEDFDEPGDASQDSSDSEMIGTPSKDSVSEASEFDPSPGKKRGRAKALSPSPVKRN